MAALHGEPLPKFIFINSGQVYIYIYICKFFNKKIKIKTPAKIDGSFYFKSNLLNQ